MNPSTLNDHMSLLSEPIGPIHESDLVSLQPNLRGGFASEAIAGPYDDQQRASPRQNEPVPWNEWDVPIGRGRAVREFVGNERYRDLIEQYRPTYLTAQKRKDKKEVSVTVYNIIKSNGGRFLAPAGNRKGAWYEISKEKTLAKIGQALRIGVRSPQFVSSSWTYPIDHDHDRRGYSSSKPSHPLYINLPSATGDGYWEERASFATDYGDRSTVSNLSFASDDAPTPSPHRELEFDAVSNEWNSSSTMDPFPFI